MYIKKTLFENKGMTFLNIVGASKIAYVILTLIKNNQHVWMVEKSKHYNRKMIGEREDGDDKDRDHVLEGDEDDDDKNGTRRLHPLKW